MGDEKIDVTVEDASETKVVDTGAKLPKAPGTNNKPQNSNGGK